MGNADTSRAPHSWKRTGYTSNMDTRRARCRGPLVTFVESVSLSSTRTHAVAFPASCDELRPIRAGADPRCRDLPRTRAETGEGPRFGGPSVCFAEGEPQSSGSCELPSDRAVRELLGVDIDVEPARIGDDRLRNGGRSGGATLLAVGRTERDNDRACLASAAPVDVSGKWLADPADREIPADLAPGDREVGSALASRRTLGTSFAPDSPLASNLTMPAEDVDEPSAPATPAESTIAVASDKAMNFRMVMFSIPSVIQPPSLLHRPAVGAC